MAWETPAEAQTDDASWSTPTEAINEPSLPSSQADIVTKSRRVGYSGLTDAEKQLFDSQIPGSTLAKGMTADEVHRRVDKAAQVNTESPSLTAMLPSVMTKGAGPWTIARDVATFPLRTVAGVGAAAGQLANDVAGTGKEPVPDAIGNALQAYMDAMRSPEASVGEAEGGVAAQSMASMANDPTTLPLLAITPGKSLLGVLGKGVGMGVATYGTHALDRRAAGADLKQTMLGETGGQLAQDVLPVALPLAAKTAGAVLSPIAENFGKAGVDHAYDMVRRMIKPASISKGGQIAEGYEKGMRGSIPGMLPEVVPGSDEALEAGVNQGLRGSVGSEEIFPQLVKRETQNVPEILENYKLLKDRIDAGFDPAINDLTAAGVRVPRTPVLKAVDQGLRDLTSQGQGWPLAEREKALKFVKDQLFVHDDPAHMRIADDLARGKEPPVAGYQTYRSKPLSGKVERDPVKRIAQLEEMAQGQRLTPEEFQMLTPAQLKGLQSTPLYKMPDGELRPLSELNRFEPLQPRTAQNLKSHLYDEAFKRGPEQDKAKEAAARIAGENLKRFLTDPTAHTTSGMPNTFSDFIRGRAELRTGLPLAGVTSRTEYMPAYRPPPSAEQIQAMAQFKNQLERAQPVYAMDEAMRRAEVTKNRYGFSLLRAAAGPMDEFRAWAQENPGMARVAYDFGKSTEGMQKFLTEKIPYTPIVFDPTKGSFGSNILRAPVTAAKNMAGYAGYAAKNAVVPPLSKAAIKAAIKAKEPLKLAPTFGAALLRGYAGTTVPQDYPGAY